MGSVAMLHGLVIRVSETRGDSTMSKRIVRITLTMVCMVTLTGREFPRERFAIICQGRIPSWMR